jgi:arylsulfatase
MTAGSRARSTRLHYETQPRAKLQDDKWELYHTRNDFSLSNDAAASNPAKLKEMQTLFMSEAAKYRVLPIDDRSFERGNPEAVGRPDLMGNRTSLALSSGMTGMTDNVFINVRNRSFSITAAVDIPSSGANGVILAQGGRFGGWSLYIKDSKPTYYYNFLGLEQYRVASPEVLPPGKSTIRVDFAYDGGGVGKGGTATVLVNGAKKASGRVERTQPTGFSFDETAGVGVDESTPVSDEYEERANSFTGTIEKVVVDVQPMGVGQAK